MNQMRSWLFIVLILVAPTAFGFPVSRFITYQPRISDGRVTALTLSSIPIAPTPQRPPAVTTSTSILKGSLSSLMKTLRADEVLRWRCFSLAFFAATIAWRKAIDGQLAQLWTYLMTSSALPAKIFRTDSYEWCLAITAFVVYIHSFGYMDRSVRKADERGLVHPWKKYRLQDRFEADKNRRMIQRRLNSQGVENIPLETMDVKPAAQVQHSPWHWQAWIFEMPVYALPLLVWDVVSPRRHRRLAPFGAPTTLQIVRDVLVGLTVYDILFFCGHILMHKIPFIYQRIHAKHHQSTEVRSIDIVRLSLVEEVLEFGFSIVALNLIGAHPVARTIYNLIITFLLTELHSGYDLPWTPQNVVPFGLATGSRRHHYHHRAGKHYYQKFFFTWDRLFGFFQKDDGTLYGDSVKRDAYVPSSWK